MPITRELIQETGSQADPFALRQIAQRVLDIDPDYFEDDVVGVSAYVEVFGVLEQEYTDRDGLPEGLPDADIEGWLFVKAVQAGMVGRQAQDKWDAVYKGVNNG